MGDRTLRQSPSGRKLGSFGFVRLSLSAPVAFVDGVAQQVPFDTIDDTSEGFGSLVTGGFGSAPGAFRLTETGIYLITTTVLVDNAGANLVVAQFLGASTALAEADTVTLSVVSVTSSAKLAALTPAPAADISTEMEVHGTSGNILSADCLIVQVG